MFSDIENCVPEERIAANIYTSVKTIDKFLPGITPLKCTNELYYAWDVDMKNKCETITNKNECEELNCCPEGKTCLIADSEIKYSITKDAIWSDFGNLYSDSR